MSKDPIAVPYQIGNHLVAGIWRYMLPAELQRMVIPAERHATCMSCPKVVSDDFRSDYRCCTYHPRIPNFLVGLALQHDDVGLAPWAGLLSNGLVIPEGMIPSPKKWAVYLTEVAEENFGKSTDILCPMLNPANGYCGMYAFRNSVCSTFYCHNDNGGKGEKFWAALETLGSQCEMALGQWAMNELGFSVDAYFARMDQLDPKQVSVHGSHGWTAEARRVLWGEWYGREKEFFLGTARLISDNRHRLWEIAMQTPIGEAEDFERRALEVIPAAYRDDAAAEQSEQDEGGESESPAKLWNMVRRAHERLWALPGGELCLSPRVIIGPNPRADAEEKFYGRFPHMLTMLRRAGHRAIAWREFITAETASALQMFAEPTLVSTPLMMALAQSVGAQDPLHFVAEWHAKKVILSPPASIATPSASS